MIYDCIIIGAGASGLACADRLSQHGSKVLILEAQSRLGGRIFTRYSPDINTPIELGPEFIHGAPKILLDTLNDLKIEYYANGGSNIYVTPKHKKKVDFWDQVEQLEKKMKIRKKDRSIQQFLTAQKSADSQTKSMFRNFMEGFHASDTAKLSETYLATAHKEAQDDGDIAKSFRITSGYGLLVEKLEEKIKASGGEIQTECEVKRIDWKKNHAKVETTRGNFHAKKIAVSLPIGVLKSQKDEKGWIDFQPRPKKLDWCLSGFEMGHVTKFVFVFKERFWEKELKEDVSFIHESADHYFPTWWTLYPVQAPVLIGWQGGIKSETVLNYSIEQTKDLALESLTRIFKFSLSKIKNLVVSWHLHDWSHDSFSKGAYSYIVVDGVPKARRLAKPFDDTLYFCGEALSRFPDVGTVHGAMESGKKTATQILKSKNT